MKAKRKITVIIVDRANYGRLKPVLLEMRQCPAIELQIICSGTMLLDRFGMAKNVILADGFKINEEVYMELEGSVPSSMVQSVGVGIIQFATALQRLKPDFVLIIGDRYEILSAAIAAVYQNICLIHLQGGEVTSSIDESTRHVITKMAHYHFPATTRAGKYITAMGEDGKTVFPLGCPSADVVVEALKNIPEDNLEKMGVGVHIDFSRPYLLTIFHPITTEFEKAEDQMQELLGALKETGKQILMLWPNIDAGSDGISQAIRRFREFNRDVPLHVYKNFEPDIYIPILARAACAVGNSSSFIRDASFLGVPIVLVGARQDGREWSEAVMRVDTDKKQIFVAINSQVAKGKYPASTLYGSPGVSKKIVDTILTLTPYAQKRLHYSVIQES